MKHVHRCVCLSGLSWKIYEVIMFEKVLHSEPAEFCILVTKHYIKLYGKLVDAINGSHWCVICSKYIFE